MAETYGTDGLTRRDVLQRGAALGLAVGGAAGLLPGIARAADLATPKPKRGGVLRVALLGGSASKDNLDPHGNGGSPELFKSARQLSFSKLAQMAPNGKFVMELAESLEPNKDASVWKIRLKKGVEFHDGQPLTSDDVIWSLKRILDPNSPFTAGRGSISMIDPAGIRRIDKHTLTLKLTMPWSDMASALGQRYISIIKNGAGAGAPFAVDTFIGTGAFKLTSWTPGSRMTYTANRNYFETGKPYLDGLDIVGIPDPVARINALVAGQVDCVCEVPIAQVPVVKGAKLNLIVNHGGQWSPFVMNTNVAPFNDPRVRQAMKLLVDRKQAIKSAAANYAELGNDLFSSRDPLYAASITQRKFDPEKARFLLKQAGKLDEQFTLYTSDAVPGGVPLALIMDQGAKKAGLKFNVETAPASTFWSETWGKKPFTFSSWPAQPLFSQWVASFVSFNAKETAWNDAKQKRASRFLYKAAATTNPTRQKALAAAAQQLLWEDGGYVIPYFSQPLDAASPRVRGIVPALDTYLSTYRMWNFWLA